jgi:hypothetical protein
MFSTERLAPGLCSVSVVAFHSHVEHEVRKVTDGNQAVPTQYFRHLGLTSLLEELRRMACSN